MSLLDQAILEKKFDTRILERNLNRGHIQTDEVEKSLKTLPDDAANAAWVNLETLAQETKRS